MDAARADVPDQGAAIEAAAPDVAADPAAGYLARNALLQRRIDVLTRERDDLLALQAVRDTPVWSTIKRAAPKVNRTYGWVQVWAAKAIKAGRLDQARKDGGAVRVNVTALIAACRQ
jgi:hypothetical protein